MKRKFKIVALLFACCVIFLGCKPSFNAGLDKYKQRDYDGAAEIWLPLAKQGHVEAQFNMAVMYHMGLGVSHDDIKVVKWYRLAAEQGHAYAQNGLGLMYARGEGVEQDYSEAVKWFRLAAKQGDVNAQNNLAVMYVKGEGVEQNYSEAVKWYRRAAEQGDVDAQNTLAAMYVKGEGVEQDYSEAVKWYRLAAEQGDVNAKNTLAVMYVTGKGVEQNYSKAVEWYRHATEQGDALDAPNILGLIYSKDKRYHEDKHVDESIKMRFNEMVKMRLHLEAGRGGISLHEEILKFSKSFLKRVNDFILRL